MQDAKQTLP